MGYATLSGTNNLVITSSMDTGMTITTVAGTQNLSDITIPTFQGNIARAILSLHVIQLNDSSGANNYLTGAQAIRISNDGGANWHTAISLSAVSVVCPANNYIQANFIFTGNNDISSYIASGGILKVQWFDAKSQGNNLRLYGITTELNLYLS